MGMEPCLPPITVVLCTSLMSSRVWVTAICAQGHPGAPTLPVGLNTAQTALPFSHKGPKGEPRTCGNSHSKSCDHYRYSSTSQRGPAGVFSEDSVGSSSCKVKGINMSFLLEFPDGQEKKVSAFPFSLSALPQHLPSHFQCSPICTHTRSQEVPVHKLKQCEKNIFTFL